MNTSIPNELLDEIHLHLLDHATATYAEAVDAEYRNYILDRPSPFR